MRQRAEDARKIERGEDRLVERFGEPAPRRLHPQDAVVLDRGVAARRLNQQTVASEFGGYARQRFEITHCVSSARAPGRTQAAAP